MVINCAVNVKENVTLSRSNPPKTLTVDNKKIKLLSKNKFNITNVKEEDKGIYDCTVCGKRRERRIILSISEQGTVILKHNIKIDI